MRVLGAVLAGGRSSRFGSDKAVADWQGATLADHAAAAIRPCVAATVVSGRDSLVDLPRAHLGPLGGIAAALDHAGSNGFDAVLTIACDMPRLPDGLLKALIRSAPAYCVESPVLGFWPAAYANRLIAYLDVTQNRSVQRWARTIGALPIVAGEPIANINTPADLIAL